MRRWSETALLLGAAALMLLSPALARAQAQAPRRPQAQQQPARTQSVPPLEAQAPRSRPARQPAQSEQAEPQQPSAGLQQQSVTARQTQALQRVDAQLNARQQQQADAAPPRPTLPRSDPGQQAQALPQADAEQLRQALPQSDAGQQPQALPQSDAELQAQPQPAAQVHTLTLPQVLQRARDNFGAVRVSRATSLRVQAQERLARGERLPSLNAEGVVGASYVNQPYAPELPRYESTAITTTAALNLDWVALSLARGARIEAAEARSLAQNRSAEDSQQRAMQAAAEQYARAVSATELVQDAQTNIEHRGQQLAAIVNLIDSGLRPGIDSQRAEIDLIAARHALEVAQIDEQAAFALLAAAIGDRATLLAQPAAFADDTLPAPRSPDDAAAVALQRRPELRALQANFEAERAAHRSDLRARLPVLGVQASGSVSHRSVVEGDGVAGGLYNAGAGVYLRWNAIDPSVWLKPAVSEAISVEASKQLAATQAEVQVQAVTAARDVQRSAALLAQSVELLGAAQRARKVQTDRYASGIASLLELLDAEALEQNARRQRIEAQREHRVARIRLLATCGEIDRLTR